MLGGAVLPSATPVPDEGSVEVTAGAIDSGIIRSGSSLQLTGSITNSTTQVVEAAVARAYLPDSSIDSASELSDWLDQSKETNLSESDLAASVQLGELATGQIRSFAISIPADRIRFGDSVKVVPIVVEIVSDGVKVASWKTVATLLPVSSSQLLSVTLVTPISAKPNSTGLLSPDELSALTSADGQLTQQLDLVSNHAFSFGIDPMILASIRALGDSAPDSAKLWLEKLLTLPNNDFALSFADANQALALHAGASSLIAPLGFVTDESSAENSPTPVPSPEPSEGDASGPTNELTDWPYSIDSISWPAPSSLIDKDLALFDKSGFKHLLLSSDQIDSASANHPLVEFADEPGLDAVVIDQSSSRLIDEASRSETLAGRNDALSALAATFAVSIKSGSKQIVVALNRDDSGIGMRAPEVLQEIEENPLLSFNSLSNVLRLPASAAQFKSAKVDQKQVSTAKSLLSAEAQTVEFSTVVDNPNLLNWPRRLGLLGMFSNYWSTDQTAWKAATAEYLANTTSILGAVHIPEGSTITLLQEKGNLPIAVANELNFPVTVYIEAKPDRAILDVLDDRVELKIEANSQAKASVPVQSIANGSVLTRLSLESKTGVSISTPTFVELNVQAGWETLATVILAAIVVLMFGAGIWRTVLKRSKAKKIEVKN